MARAIFLFKTSSTHYYKWSVKIKISPPDIWTLVVFDC